MNKLKMYRYEDLQEWQLIQWFGVHVVKWAEWKKIYGIPDPDYAFVCEEEEEEEEDE